MRASAAPVERSEVGPAVVPRGVELWLAVIGAILSTVLLGGYSAVVNRLDKSTFEAAINPAFLVAEGESQVEAAFTAGSTLSSWFGVTLILVLGLAAVGVLGSRRRSWSRSPGWWMLAAGLVCLFGSQLLLFPVAFLFFLSAGLFAARSVPRETTND